jgi:hypothetical protein
MPSQAGQDVCHSKGKKHPSGAQTFSYRGGTVKDGYCHAEGGLWGACGGCPVKADEEHGGLQVGYTGAQCADPCIGKGLTKHIGTDSNRGYCMACTPSKGNHKTKSGGVYDQCTRCYPGFVLVP